MVEVILSKQEQEVAEGCTNTEELTERLLDSYVAVHKLQNAIKNLNNDN